MSEKRITVWVQRFKDRDTLMLQWTDPDTGKRKSRSAGTADDGEAEKQRADLEYELNHGLHKEASAMPWERFRETFEDEYLPNCRGDTRRNYRGTFDLFEKVCRPKNLRSITERTVSAFAAGLRKLPGRGSEFMQASSVRLRLQLLHTALTWAAEQKLLPACPNFPTVKVPKKRPQPVPVESFERLLDKAPDHQWRVYLLCAWLAGLRLGETLELEWEENSEAPYLDPDRDRIVLPAEFVKAVEDQWLPLDPALWDALQTLPRQGKRVFHFIGKRTGKPLALTTVSGFVATLAKRAGVRLTMKSLRRGFGCRYAGKVPAQVLQKLMRHSNIKTTMDYYANVDDAVMKAVLGENFGSRNSSRNTPRQAPAAPGEQNGENNGGDRTSDT
jgi:integrase